MFPIQYSQFIAQCNTYRRMNSELIRQIRDLQREFDEIYYNNGEVLRRAIRRNVTRSNPINKRHHSVSLQHGHAIPQKFILMSSRPTVSATHSFQQQFRPVAQQQDHFGERSFINSTPPTTQDQFMKNEPSQSGIPHAVFTSIHPDEIESGTASSTNSFANSTTDGISVVVKEEVVGPIESNLFDPSLMYYPEPDIDVQEIVIMADDVVSNSEEDIQPSSPFNQLIIDTDFDSSD